MRHVRRWMGVETRFALMIEGQRLAAAFARPHGASRDMLHVIIGEHKGKRYQVFRGWGGPIVAFLQVKTLPPYLLLDKSDELVRAQICDCGVQLLV
jgi:hypothetical protein